MAGGGTAVGGRSTLGRGPRRELASTGERRWRHPGDRARSDGRRGGRTRFFLRPTGGLLQLHRHGVDRGECDPARAEFLNSRLPELLVRLACKHADFSWSGQQVVHLSSDFERSAPSTLYGGTKAAGASNFVRACHALGVRGVAARLFTVYGPGERSDRLLPALLGLLDTSDDLPLTDGLQQRDFTYVEDVSQGLLRLAASPAKSGEIVDLGSGRITTVREFATTVARLGGISPARLRFGALRRRVEDQRTVTAVPADTKRLRELTGWIPATTIEEGIRRTLRRQLAHSQSLTG